MKQTQKRARSGVKNCQRLRANLRRFKNQSGNMLIKSTDWWSVRQFEVGSRIWSNARQVRSSPRGRASYVLYRLETIS